MDFSVVTNRKKEKIREEGERTNKKDPNEDIFSELGLRN